MSLLQSFRMATRSILARKGRAGLTILSIFIGVGALIALVSRQQAKTDQWVEYLKNTGTNRIQVYASMWGGKDFTGELYDFCLGMTDLVDGVTPVQYGDGGNIRYGSKTYQAMQLLFGSDQYTECSGSTLVKGRDFGYMDIEKANRVCIIGSAVRRNLFNYKDPIGESITINKNTFTVIGVYGEKMDSSQWSEDNIIVVPYTLNRLLLKNTTIEQFTVKAKDASTTKAASDKLNVYLLTMYKNRPNGYYNVSSMNQAIEETNEQEKQEVTFLYMMAGIMLLVGGIGIMNIMLVTVTERTREIGVRKAIGAERRSIILQFLVETSMVSGLGGVAGVVAGVLATLVWVKLEQDKIFYPPPAILAIAFGVSVALGIFFGLYPALKASRLQPVDALRNE